MESRKTTSRKNRRSFLKQSLATGAMTVGATALAESPLFAQGGSLTRGDAALLRFAAAAELIETDLWQQYAELGGVTDGEQNTYQQAFEFLDGDGPQYITSNTLDELSHATFLNAYLESKGEEPVNFDQFRTLAGSQATGARNIGRLTTLFQLNVDTSWYIRDRSTTNPDFGAKYPQALQIVDRRAIPKADADFENPERIQSIANIAAFHFGAIEQGGSSLYATFAQKASNLEVLRILLGIGGDEIRHFGEWMDFAGNAVQGPPFSFAGQDTPVTNHGLTFSNFNDPMFGPLFQTNLIFPVPCEFISPNLPWCAVIRPIGGLGTFASAAANAFIQSNLFMGQSPTFISMLKQLAAEADQASRGF